MISGLGLAVEQERRDLGAALLDGGGEAGPSKGRTLGPVGGAAFKPGGDHGHVDLALEPLIDDGADDDVGLWVHHVVDHL